MNKEKYFELKIGKKTYLIEIKNVEKSMNTAEEMLRELIINEISGTKNFTRAS